MVDGSEYVHYLNELEWVRGEIWANVWHKDQIARIDPQSGRVVAWLDLAHLAPAIRAQNPEAVPNGIAFDEQTGRLFVTGKLWPVLYEIRLPRSQARPSAGIRLAPPKAFHARRPLSNHGVIMRISSGLIWASLLGVGACTADEHPEAERLAAAAPAAPLCGAAGHCRDCSMAGFACHDSGGVGARALRCRVAAGGGA